MTNSEKVILEEKVKDFAIMELNDAKKYNEYALSCRNQAYGVIFFACNELFNIYNSNLADWWEREMLPQFNKIIMRD